MRVKLGYNRKQVRFRGMFDVGMEPEFHKVLPAAACANGVKHTGWILGVRPVKVHRDPRLVIESVRPSAGGGDPRSQRTGEQHVFGSNLSVRTGADKMNWFFVHEQTSRNGLAIDKRPDHHAGRRCGPRDRPRAVGGGKDDVAATHRFGRIGQR